ncbi:5-(carboxyamino)imidazole ribonucleotide synthase [Agarivorans gilvus]|jgi:5-(carboxyamino)imidazole ribonucleotide synthase|uniref:N5-carboxyaminoimidazole ribonucleotide synthase n=1 Tax=Agarivorans gilvus TaxID=680279 RepID=A0ABQ1I1U0_9ALTE|nr:5-(carboxyamino)imidazole ribonucleotide synthase [Agarivorans gilvus]GGB04163.1 N5-carboxyaminoimidazole ribonucleotide synthase [Agarivorans gilvus]
MNKIWILGAGQLGAMLKHAAQPLNIEVRPVETDETETFDIANDDIITVEREHWPSTAATEQLTQHPRFLNGPALVQLADRASQKKLLDSLQLATAPWVDVKAQHSAEQLFAELGERVLLKQRSGGYDGKGQHWLKLDGSAEQRAIPQTWLDHCIAEQAIAFEEEVSLIGMRHANGEMAFYPLAINQHHQGILLATVSPVASKAHLQSQAEAMLAKLMDALDYVGVMTMECFQVGDKLLINEIAPRVHNSGHWTQAGSSLSQFEAHIRAVANLPLVQPLVKTQSVMLNLIGVDYNTQWLSVPGIEVFWYGKEVRPGRKVGHINISIAERQQLLASLSQLQPLMSPVYADAIEWLIKHLD